MDKYCLRCDKSFPSTEDACPFCHSVEWMVAKPPSAPVTARRIAGFVFIALGFVMVALGVAFVYALDHNGAFYCTGSLYLVGMFISFPLSIVFYLIGSLLLRPRRPARR